jgi:CDGSH-type Zn-finger protein
MAEITIMDNGPIKVTGGIVVKDMAGKPIPLPNPQQFALGRCGASAKKPFCDGAHKAANFQSKISSS